MYGACEVQNYQYFISLCKIFKSFETKISNNYWNTELAVITLLFFKVQYNNKVKYKWEFGRCLLIYSVFMQKFIQVYTK